ncbi:MAG: FixH family protein [Chloroflexi bacterium]|nr:FixH family protein [Chloroflexota bacterium]
MKKSALTIFVTAAVTAVLLFILFIFLMPTLGPRFMHPLMAGNMPENRPAAMAAMMNSAAPAELDTAADRLTDNGLFNVSYSSDLDPIAINQMHSWTLLVTTPDGQPVADAIILVDGGMPQHGHGLPTQPQVTEYLGNGRYRVEGLRFQMGGWWEVKFDITAADQNDAITFNLALAG